MSYANNKKWRKKKGEDIYKRRYSYLRQKGFSPKEATKYKFYSDENIEKLVNEKNVSPLNKIMSFFK
ncbi:MAG: hypothetical protein ACOC56_05125 [Atribacterota bacterium]